MVCWYLTHLTLVPHICVSEMGQHWFRYGLLLNRHQAIIWTNAGLLSNGPLGTNCSEVLIKLQNFPSQKCTWKYSLWKSSHFVQGGDELNDNDLTGSEFRTHVLTETLSWQNSDLIGWSNSIGQQKAFSQDLAYGLYNVCKLGPWPLVFHIEAEPSVVGVSHDGITPCIIFNPAEASGARLPKACQMSHQLPEKCAFHPRNHVV